MADPVIRPGRGRPKDDPQGIGPSVRVAWREINKRWDGALKAILARFDSVERETIQVNENRTIYQMTPLQLREFNDYIGEVLNTWIEEGRTYAPGMWWDKYITDAAFLAMSQELVNLAGQSEEYKSRRSLVQAVNSPEYQNRVATAQLRSYEHWRGASAELREVLAGITRQAVAEGLNPKQARKLYQEATESSASKARSYAQTDILGVMRETKMAEGEFLRQNFGLQTGLLWTSALMPNRTRPWHAERHGRVYAKAQVEKFYSERGNRYNCFCSITQVLLDDKGKPIMSDKLKNLMSGELDKFNDSTEPAANSATFMGLLLS